REGILLRYLEDGADWWADIEAAHDANPDGERGSGDRDGGDRGGDRHGDRDRDRCGGRDGSAAKPVSLLPLRSSPPTPTA
ncbi:hypothetical protein ACWCQR_38245, partial [Streptomyces sp. NPDC002172]